MEDAFELTITINKDSFPLLYDFLNDVKSGRRRAAAFKRLAEAYLLLQVQRLVHSASTTLPESGGSQTTSLREPVENDQTLSINKKAVRESLRQFGFD